MKYKYKKYFFKNNLYQFFIFNLLNFLKKNYNKLNIKSKFLFYKYFLKINVFFYNNNLFYNKETFINFLKKNFIKTILFFNIKDLNKFKQILKKNYIF